jgi:hypothetical protein
MDFVWIFSFQNKPFINAYTLMGAFWERQNHLETNFWNYFLDLEPKGLPFYKKL